jgi:hypothetical protein
MKRHLLAILCVLLIAPGSFAIVDTNNNGLSDLWEKAQNNGELFAETFDPNADSDSDGWTNAQEAAAGTNPLDPNPPDGIISTEIVHIPAVMGEENGVPVVITPEAITVSWPTITGKQYTLLVSPDLTEVSWLPVEDSFIGNGNITTYFFYSTEADKCFWRVSVTDADSDTDGLTDTEEREIGSSPYFADTNNNGIGDADEFAAGNDPSADTQDGNGDGIPDNHLYSIMVEVLNEWRHQDPFSWHSVLTGVDEVHRYMTKVYSETYSISDSPRYQTVENGVYSRTDTCKNAAGGFENQPQKKEGMDLGDWRNAHEIDLGQGESVVWGTEQTTVVPSPTMATVATTTTTTTKSWAVKKDGNTIRSGTETTVETKRTELFDPCVIQDVWSFFKSRAWQEDEAGWQRAGPPEGMDPAELDADTAWWIRNIYKSNTSLMHSEVSWPYQGQGTCGDSRLKAMRWRWVKFNPLNPSHPEYTAPPEGYKSSFHFFVYKWDRDDWTWESQQATQGLVELRCEGGSASGDWNNVDMSLFEPYREEDPWKLTTMDFTSGGHSAVFFRGCDAGLKKRMPVIADEEEEATWYTYERVTALPREVPLPGMEIYQKDIADGEITISAKIYDPVADVQGTPLPHAWVNSRSVTPVAGDKPGVYKLPGHTYKLHPGRNEITVAVENALGACGYETLVVEGDEETGYALIGEPVRVPEKPTYPVVFSTPGAESTQVTLKIGTKSVQPDMEPKFRGGFGEWHHETKPFLSILKPETATAAQIAAIPATKPLFVSELEDNITIESSFPSLPKSVLILPQSGVELSSPDPVEVLETTEENPQLSFKTRRMGSDPVVKATLTTYRVDEAQEDVKSKILTPYQTAWQALPAAGKDAVVSFEVEDLEYKDGYNGLAFGFGETAFLNHTGRHDSFRFPAPNKAGVRVFSANRKKDAVLEGVTGRTQDIWYPVAADADLTDLGDALATSGCQVVGMTDLNECFEDSPLKRSFIVRGPPGNTFQAFDKFYTAQGREQRSQTFDADGTHGAALAEELDRVQTDGDLPASAKNALALEIAGTYQFHNGFEDFVPKTHQPYVDPGTGTPQPNSWTMRGSSLPDHAQSNPGPWTVTNTLSDPIRAASVSGIVKVDTTAENTAYYATTFATAPWNLSGARAVSLRFKLLTHDAANGADGAFQLAAGDGTRTWTCQVASAQVKVQGTTIALPAATFPTGLIDGKFHTLQINLSGTGNDALVSIDGEVLTATAASQNGTLNGIAFGDPGASIAGKFEVETLGFENSDLRYQYGIYDADAYADSDEIDGVNNILLYLRSKGQAFRVSPIARWVRILDPDVHEWLLDKYTGKSKLGYDKELHILTNKDVWLGSTISVSESDTYVSRWPWAEKTKITSTITLDKEETKIWSTDQTRNEMQLAGILMAWCYEQVEYRQWLAQRNGQYDEIILIDKKHLVDNISKCAKRVETTLELGGEIAISITNEYADYAITINSLRQGDYMAMVGFIPLVPSSTAKAFKFLNKADGATIEAIHQLSKKLDDFPGGKHEFSNVNLPGNKRILDFDKIFANVDDVEAVARARKLTSDDLIPNSGWHGKELLDTFSNSNVSIFKTKQPIKAYRCFSSNPNISPYGASGGFLMFEKPLHRTQVEVDYALGKGTEGFFLKNADGSSAYDRYVEVEIPEGVYVYMGYAADQGGTFKGGGTQLWIDDTVRDGIEWNVPWNNLPQH